MEHFTFYSKASRELLFMDSSEINCFKRRMKVMPVAEGGAINFSANLPRFSLNFVESISNIVFLARFLIS